MPDVLITCSLFKGPTNTGLSMSRKAYRTAKLEDLTASCSLCQGNHTWSKKDSYLADEPD